MTDTRKIAKNTAYMYTRMILIMVVSLYTSRVILDKLGIDDYGLYNAVASVVAMIMFLNVTLSTSTSRFLTFDLGKRNIELLRNTFSTTFFTHLFLALMIILVMETIGLWYMNCKFVIPEGRELATHVVFQISIITTAVSVCIVPYTALLSAHEDLNIYAYVGILDVILRLSVLYFLNISPIDKLITYACLLLGVQIVIAFIYVTISLNRYVEAKIKLIFSTLTFRKMLGFTSWTAVANLSNIFTVQGTVLLLNLFFAPAIIAAKSLADQVSAAIMQFVNNFRTALNPQIIKSYAANDKEESKRLTLKSTIISFDLMLIMGMPFIFTMNKVLGVWLKEVPAHAVLFTQLAIISQIINTMSSSTYIAFVSSGKLRNNALYGLLLGVFFFIVLYVIYLCGGEAVWVQYLYLVLTIINIFLLRPYLLKKDVGYSLAEVLLCYWECLKVLVPSLLFSYILYMIFPDEMMWQIGLFLCVFIICIICSYLFMGKDLKRIVKSVLIDKYWKLVYKR